MQVSSHLRTQQFICAHWDSLAHTGQHFLLGRLFVLSVFLGISKRKKRALACSQTTTWRWEKERIGWLYCLVTFHSSPFTRYGRGGGIWVQGWKPVIFWCSMEGKEECSTIWGFNFSVSSACQLTLTLPSGLKHTTTQITTTHQAKTKNNTKHRTTASVRSWIEELALKKCTFFWH